MDMSNVTLPKKDLTIDLPICYEPRSIRMLVFKMHPDSRLPQKATPHAAGYDVYAYGSHTIRPGEIKIIPTGIKARIQDSDVTWTETLGVIPNMKCYEIQVRPRSGYASKGLTVANAPGTIDFDYRGEIMVILVNHSQTEFNIENGDRIAQLVIQEVLPTVVVDVNEEQFTDEVTTRMSNGLGSTGK